jgi:uncharacterized membrane protein HdeD (DUF308 family)
MIRLALLLLGPDFIRTRWLVLAIAGAVWAALGVAIFLDALKGDRWFPVHLFGYFLIVEALVTLVATTSNLGTRTVLRKTRGVVFLIVGILMIDPHRAAEFILALIFGAIIGINGLLRISAAWVVRFPGWRLSLCIGVLELLFAIFMIEPYPTFYAGTVAYCVGMIFFLSGLGTLLMALRLRRLPSNVSLAVMFARNCSPGDFAFAPKHAALPSPSTPQVAHAPLVVHVWTPAGSAKDVLPQPLVDRYVAAVDANGVISTGHAALEADPGIYVSHYPANEIDHSPDDFRHLLRATEDNNVPGLFQPSYSQESAGWCPSTARVLFERYDRSRLEAFWSAYSQDNTYNLTYRNCSSTAAAALESALEGTLGHNRGFGAFLSALVNPELWVASQLRRHAELAAWTPGLVLDYARSLRVAIDPPPLGVVTLTNLGLNFVRGMRARREFVATVRARTAAAAHEAAARAAAGAAGKSRAAAISKQGAGQESSQR